MASPSIARMLPVIRDRARRQPRPASHRPAAPARAITAHQYVSAGESGGLARIVLNPAPMK